MGWWSDVEAECLATRQGVALFDMSSFGKLHISGSGAEAAMEWCASSEIATANAGQVIYTQMLNDRGGIESDLTIVPLPNSSTLERAFYVVTGSATCTRDADNIARASRLHEIENVHIREVTDEWAVLALMGPESRAVMNIVFPDIAFDNDAFPFATSQELCCAAASNVRALRVSFAGELGWEMHCPKEYAPALWGEIHASGLAMGVNGGMGVVNAGYRALLLSLRLEKKFVHFGHDVSPTDSPFEAGLSFVSGTKLKAGTPFRGRQAFLDLRARGCRRRLVSFKVKDERVSLWGGEGIYCDGVRVGKLTSGGFGHSVNSGRAIGIGYVTPTELLESDDGLKPKALKVAVMEGGQYELEVAGRRVQAEVVWDALYDPGQQQLRQ